MIFKAVGSFFGLVSSGVVVDKLTKKEETFWEKNKEIILILSGVLLFFIFRKK